ncbi:coiled-coil domain-containing protein mad1 [Phlyctochytrium bullatum]|nr:coiled-coil domain-containing protein mad1 [Phlyctochytrium bullatum]
MATRAAQDSALRDLAACKRSNSLLQKQVDILKEQLVDLILLNRFNLSQKAYDIEEEEMSAKFDRLKSERLGQLETVIAEYQSRVAELEIELQKSKVSVPPPSTPTVPASVFSSQAAEKIEALEAELAELRKEKFLLEKEFKAACEQITILENAFARGAFDNTALRVVQMVDNPMSQELRIRKTTLDALQSENEDLRNILAGKKPKSILYPESTLRSLELKCEEYDRLVKEKEKRTARLKEVYAAKAQEYREAVFSLLGYKVDFQEGRVKLVSTYSKPEDPSFLFTSGPNDEGTMQLVGGSRERLPVLQRARQYYIDERGSVPAFLASVTLSGWERAANIKTEG